MHSASSRAIFPSLADDVQASTTRYLVTRLSFAYPSRKSLGHPRPPEATSTSILLRPHGRAPDTLSRETRVDVYRLTWFRKWRSAITGCDDQLANVSCPTLCTSKSFCFLFSLFFLSSSFFLFFFFVLCLSTREGEWAREARERSDKRGWHRAEDAGWRTVKISAVSTESRGESACRGSARHTGMRDDAGPLVNAGIIEHHSLSLSPSLSLPFCHRLFNKLPSEQTTTQ